MDNISALMDGELEDADAQRQIASLKTDPAARARWDEFHLIGDALRGEPLLKSRVADRVAARLGEEPTVLAPQRRIRKPARVTTYALSAAASVSAAALVAWVALTPGTGPDLVAGGAAVPAAAVTTAGVATPATPSPAATAASVPASGAPVLANVPSDGSVKDYILAHEAAAPSSRLQGLTPFIRTVSAIRQGESR